MITRTTTQMMMSTAGRNLQANAAALARIQDQSSSLKAISRPSDDPVGTGDSMRIRAEQRATAQYGRNIDDGNAWLSTVDSALSDIEDLLRRARDLTLRGANASMPQSAKDSIAVEVEGLRNDILGRANTQYLGRSVFAGNSNAGAAFQQADPLDPATAYTFTGEAGSAVERRIDAGATVRVDADGKQLFGEGAGSVFALLDRIVTDLRTGGDVGSNLNALDASMATIVSGHAEVGARHARVLAAKEDNMQQAGSLESTRSSIEDLDLGQLILELKMQELTYQSSLAVTARVLQPTLMDFLR